MELETFQHAPPLQAFTSCEQQSVGCFLLSTAISLAAMDGQHGCCITPALPACKLCGATTNGCPCASIHLAREFKAFSREASTRSLSPWLLVQFAENLAHCVASTMTTDWLRSRRSEHHTTAALTFSAPSFRSKKRASVLNKRPCRLNKRLARFARVFE